MKRTILSLALVAALVGNVFATDLWNNQQNVANSVNSYVNQQFGGAFAAYDTYEVSDVVAGNWNVTSIGVQVSASNPAITNGMTFSATLNVFANSGALPSAGNNPTTGTAVTVTMNSLGTVNGQNYYNMVVSGLNLNLTAGEYWIGLTPAIDFGTYGQAFEVNYANNQAGGNYGDASINPGGGFGSQYSTWGSTGTYFGSATSYGGIDIQGTVNSVPEPSSFAAIAVGLLGLVTIKRRK